MLQCRPRSSSSFNRLLLRMCFSTQGTRTVHSSILEPFNSAAAAAGTAEAFLSQASDSSHPLIKGISKLLSEPQGEFASPDVQKFYKRKNNSAYLSYRRARSLRRKQGVEMKPRQYLLLMTHWAKKAGPKIDQSMFEQMLKVGVPPTTAYTTMIKHFVIRAAGEEPRNVGLGDEAVSDAEKCILEALKYLHEMREKSITPTSTTYAPLVRWFLEFNKKAELQEILEWMMQDGLECYSALFLGYGVMGMHEEACNYFKSLKEIDPSEQLHSEFLSAYIRGLKQSSESVKRFKHIVENFNIKPYTDCYISMINQSCKEGHIHQALDLIQDAQVRGVGVTPGFFGPLFHLFRDGVQPRAAFELFAAMKRMGVQPSQDTFYSMIRVCVKSNDVERMFELLAEMQELGIPRTAEVYNAMIQAFGRANQFSRAMKTLHDMENDHFKPDSITYTELLYGCHDHKVALELVKKMNTLGITLTEAILGRLFTLMAKCGEIDKGLEILSDQKKMGVSLRSKLLIGLAQARRLDEALACFQEIRDEGKLPEPYAFGSLIEALGYAGKLDRMIELFEDTFKYGMWRKRDEVFVEEQQIRCCMFITKACIFHNDLRRLETLLEKADYINSSTIFDTIILSIPEGGDAKTDFLNFTWEDGFSLLDLMHKLKFPVSRLLLEALLEGCIILKDVGRAENILKEMERNDLQQNIFTYLRLLRLYVAVEDITKVASVLGRMKGNLKDEDIFYLVGHILNTARPNIQKQIFRMIDN